MVLIAVLLLCSSVCYGTIVLTLLVLIVCMWWTLWVMWLGLLLLLGKPIIAVIGTVRGNCAWVCLMRLGHMYIVVMCLRGLLVCVYSVVTVVGGVLLLR